MYALQDRLAGKVAFITGAARGQGRAEAVRLAAEGADIIAVDNCSDATTTAYPGATKEDLVETGRLVEEQGRQVVTAVVDTRDYSGLETALRDGAAHLGGIDVVVANAGICSANLLWQTTPEQWQETIDVNLTGTFHTLKATATLLVEQDRGGSVIVISSIAGLCGLPFLAAYVASKHGIVGLTRTLANELGQYGIRVNSIHPNGVNTGMSVGDLPPLLEAHAATLGPIYMSAIPTPAMVEPEDIAATVAWLASDDAKYVTGSQIPVDLGKLTR